MNEAQRNVALFRYSLIREAADDALTIRQRGVLVRELTARTHTGPAGRPVHISRGTLDRWIHAYRAGGFEALAPTSRTGEPATDKRLLDLAEALKRECRRGPATGRLGRAQPALQRMGRDRLSPPRPLRDRCAPDRASSVRASCGAADPSGAPRGLLVVRSPHGDQDGHRLAALEHL